MWECSYSKEPVDFRLLWCRVLKKIWVILLATVAGAVLFCGLHVVKRIVVNGGRTYMVTDILDISYVGDVYDKDVNYFYFNYYTWNEISDLEDTIDSVYNKLDGTVSKDTIRECTKANVEADVHHLYLYTTLNDREQALKISNAFRETMIEFVESYDRMDGVRVLTSGRIQDVSDLKIFRAIITGLIIGFFVGTLSLLIAEITDSSVRVPATLEKRYHIPTLTAVSMEEFGVNCESMLEGLHNIAIVPVDKKSIPEGLTLSDREVKVYEDVLSNKAELDEVKNSDGCIITVAAGAHNGSSIERTLEQLSRNGIKVNASLLIKEDTALLKKYYHL